MCQKRCKTCQHTFKNCTECANSLYRLNSPPYCNCMEGYHDNEGTLLHCVKC